MRRLVGRTGTTPVPRDTHHVPDEQMGGQTSMPLGPRAPRASTSKRRPKPALAPDRPQFAFAFLEPQRTKKGRAVYLRVVQERCGTFDNAKPGLPPGGRAECRTGPRPCPYVRCKHHLWLVEGSDRAGQRGRGALPPTELEPRWLDPQATESCALDIAERAARTGVTTSITEIGAAMGRDDSSVWLWLQSALRKLREGGVEIAELLGG